MDWKEILLAKSEELGIAPDSTANLDNTADTTDTNQYDPSLHPALHVIVERKGRGGKTATIIEGFNCSETELKKIAAKLKSTLGTGGSARGGEILIQGECRERVRTELKKLGFKLKG